MQLSEVKRREFETEALTAARVETNVGKRELED
jgi:hypothetical protein